MRRGLFLLALLLVWATSAFAFEADIHGYYQYDFRYFARTGTGDLFGDVGVAQSAAGNGLTSIGFAGPNAGAVVLEGLSSKGSDGSFNTEKMVFFTNLRLNPAVSLKFRYSFQGSLNGQFVGGANFANPQHYGGSWFSNARTEEVTNAIAPGFLNWAYADINMPIGRLYVGRRPIAFGPGWAGFHADDSAFFLVGLSVPYGPLALFMGQDLSSTGNYTDPYDSRNVNLSPLTIVSMTDRNQVQKWSSVYSLAYDNGPLSLGVLNRTTYYQNEHAWPQGAGTFRDDRTNSVAGLFLNSFRAFSSGGTDATTTLYPIYGDLLWMGNVFYVKYNNGHFFFNGEFDWQYLKATRIGGRPISGRPYSWMAELGAFGGPAKLSLAGFYRTGHDRQGGILDVVSTTGQNQQTAIQVGDTWNQYIMFGGGHAPLDPYQFITGFYGAGNNAYDAAGFPTYVDFFGLGGRLDYAIAANLNLFASYLYSRRASNTSNWLGQFNGNGPRAAATRGANVPNNNLGQEVDFGLSWKILENVCVDGRAGFWKPGAWFKGAYTDYSLATPITVSGQDFYVNPNRSISPIFGLETAITLTF
jgi:hypothetical protein